MLEDQQHTLGVTPQARVPGRVRRSQSPNSWLFYDARIRAGFPTLDSLAQRISVPKATILLWQRGGRPAPERIRQLHEVLGVPLDDVVQALYGERIGDLCRGGCGRPKVFSEKFPGSRSLAIDASCACGTERILKPYQCREHRKLCPKCRNSIGRVERIPFTCIGYRDHNAHRTAKNCHGTILLAPWQINRLRQQAENGQRGRAPNSRFDASSRTYQCAGCSNSERLLKQKEKKIRELQAKKNPYQNVDRIRSGAQRVELESKLSSELIPNLIKAGTKALKTRERKGGYKSAGGTRAHLTIALLHAPRRQYGRCRFCNLVVVTKRKNPEFHPDCFLDADGRGLKSLRGLKVSLPPRRRGHPIAGKSLKIWWDWSIQFGLIEKSLRDIGEDTGTHFTKVRKRINFLIKHLDPEKVEPPFQQQARELIEAVGKRQHSLE